ncbi:MAG: UDP-N-acetylmuramate--L-alanine ligase [Tepidisphaeraceae bacterium]
MRMESQLPTAWTGQRVHFIGIGGAGMSGLARVLLDCGAIVTGSDKKPNEQTLDLHARGAAISFQQRGELISSDTALVVRTAAVTDDNPEYELAVRLKIPTTKYAQLLGRVMQTRFGVAVAGTHGKSTTTAMLCHALLTCGADPSFVVGGNVKQLGGGSRSGGGPHFVVEACEYDRSFHNLRPRIAILNNIEPEHLDCYGDLDAIINAFRTFAQLVPTDGLVFARGDDTNVRQALESVDRPVQTFGIGDSGFTWRIEPTQVVAGCHHGDVYHRGVKVATVRPGIAGEHNLLNATCALAAAIACGIDPQQAADALSTFTGVDRRMSEMGKLNGAIVVDDYGHHPTEVRVTLKALREKYHPDRLICVFQPHQHSRTRLLLDQFATSFDEADETIIPEIYAVRDSAADKAAVTSEDLVNRIGRSAVHVSTFPDVIKRLRQTARPGDVIVTMGAGNVYEVAKGLVGEG